MDADVLGEHVHLGTVHRMIVDARSKTVTDLVVKHGFAWGTERILPLGHITGVDSAGVHVDLDEQGFQALNGYADDRRHAPESNYVGPPGFDTAESMLDLAAAGGSTLGLAASGGIPPLGFPGGEQISPDDLQRPAIALGMSVLDSAGEKVGEVHQLGIDARSGEPTRLVLRRGHLFHADTPIPPAWIAELSDKGVLLGVDRQELEKLARRLKHD